ncbi:MAG: ATP-binding protein [Geminicoccaceae bacterium]
MAVSTDSSLLSRTLWRVLPAIVLVQLAIGWMAWEQLHELVSNELHHRLEEEGDLYAQLVATKLGAVIGSAKSVAENDLIVNGIVDTEGRDQYISVFFETAKLPGFVDAEVTLTDYKGRRIASNNPAADYIDAAWRDRVLAGQVWYDISEGGLVVAVPVMISGRGEGMIVIRYDRPQLADLLAVSADAEAINILTTSGVRLFASNVGFTYTSAEAARSSDWQTVSAPVPEFDELLLLVGERRATAFTTVARLGYFLTATILTSVAAVAVAIVTTALMSTRPIARFAQGIEQVTRTGDLGHTIEPEGAQEFHRLAGSFNRMLASLRTMTAYSDELQELNLVLDRVNAELEESEARYQLAIEGSAVGIWDWNARDESVFWSERLQRMLGMTDTVATLKLEDTASRLHSDDHDRFMKVRQQHLAGEGDYDIECRFRHENGSYVWLHVRGQAVWDKAGNVVRMAGSANDVTARKSAELERDRHAAELERSNRELDDFAHIASHDLREPLRALSNHVSILLEDYGEKLDEDGAKRLNRLATLCSRMDRLISDLLAYSRIRRGDVADELVNLNAVIADIDVSLADLMRRKNARLVIPEPLPPVIADRPHMMTVFQNLITNAIKYNESEEKIVEIGFERKDGEADDAEGIVFHVRDNGIGIDDTFKDDVFRIFKRLNSEKVYGEGTGAGLTFVKKIFENRGGKIWFDSIPGEGTAFYFTMDGGRS